MQGKAVAASTVGVGNNLGLVDEFATVKAIKDFSAVSRSIFAPFTKLNWALLLLSTALSHPIITLLLSNAKPRSLARSSLVVSWPLTDTPSPTHVQSTPPSCLRDYDSSKCPLCHRDVCTRTKSRGGPETLLAFSLCLVKKQNSLFHDSLPLSLVLRILSLAAAAVETVIHFQSCPPLDFGCMHCSSATCKIY